METTSLITSNLPVELQLAQQAIQLPEIQDIIKVLSKYNLGVCMPHMHDSLNGDFLILPHDTVQVEGGLQVDFKKIEDVDLNNNIPVGWRWQDDGVKASATCFQFCTEVETQSGNKSHYRQHGRA